MASIHYNESWLPSTSYSTIKYILASWFAFVLYAPLWISVFFPVPACSAHRLYIKWMSHTEASWWLKIHNINNYFPCLHFVVPWEQFCRHQAISTVNSDYIIWNNVNKTEVHTRIWVSKNLRNQHPTLIPM